MRRFEEGARLSIFCNKARQQSFTVPEQSGLNQGLYISEPVSCDASASAYHIIYFMLLDLPLAEQTNLIRNEEIRDIYSIMEEKLLPHLEEIFEGKFGLNSGIEIDAATRKKLVYANNFWQRNEGHGYNNGHPKEGT